ncbi:LuxR C-terminal-related transcriptional regulator [Deinococcus pimensis]|uniref:LuxR C-terminal-related transcriptional regulator n=1 Tax=Deinococcus pimensis TaxID=309888 RepID=UPI0004AF7106|nr:LuxR C-terminal-related transcriptional regulator [Deinococcus pimensis]
MTEPSREDRQPSSPIDASRRREWTELLGRAREVAQGVDLLSRDDVGLVTITGMGGIGKTRVALHVAERLGPHFPDGVKFVPLASVTHAELVPQAVAAALGLGGDRAAEAVFGALRDAELLLVLDNLEHVIDAAAFVAELLVEAPRVRVLTTSRTPLQLTGEHELPLLPLALPSPSDRVDRASLLKVPSVALFVRLADTVHPGRTWDDERLAHVVNIVTRLGGWPLGLELAAARLRLLSLADLERALDTPLNVLTRGARDLPARQRTLRATLDWSHALLEPDERTLLARLAVFPATFTPKDATDALGDIGRLDVLSALVEHHWVVRPDLERDGLALLEPVREYALERLVADGALDLTRAAHAHTYAANLERHLTRGYPTRPYYVWIHERYPHLRAALHWALTNDFALAVRVGLNLTSYWIIGGSGLLSEGRVWTESLLARASETDDLTVARLTAAVALFAARQDEFEVARRMLERALPVTLRVGDEHDVADVILRLGSVARMSAQVDPEAERLLRDAAARFERLDDPHGKVNALVMLAAHLDTQGRFGEALDVLGQLRPELRNLTDPSMIVRALVYVGWLLIRVGRAAEARGPLEEANAHLMDLPTPGLWLTVFHGLAEWAYATDHDDLAESYLAEAYTRALDLGSPQLLAGIHETQARLALRRGERDRALELYRLMLDRVGPDGPAYLRREAHEGLARLAGRGDTPSPSPAPASARPSPSASYLTDLTARETEVLRLLVQGDTNVQIGRTLGISLPTVNAHVRTIFSKLGVGSRVLATRVALERHLV